MNAYMFQSGVPWSCCNFLYSGVRFLSPWKAERVELRGLRAKRFGLTVHCFILQLSRRKVGCVDFGSQDGCFNCLLDSVDPPHPVSSICFLSFMPHATSFLLHLLLSLDLFLWPEPLALARPRQKMFPITPHFTFQRLNSLTWPHFDAKLPKEAACRDGGWKCRSQKRRPTHAESRLAITGGCRWSFFRSCVFWCWHHSWFFN